MITNEPIRERLKLLLKAHHNDIQPSRFTVEEGALLLRQGDPADQVLLLSKGSVAIQVRQHNTDAHTLAVLEAEELLGEMGLFGNGFHSADVRVVEGPAELISVPADQLLQALLFDSDLAIELLAMLSHRCLVGNLLVAELLDGIAAAHQGDQRALQQSCQALRERSHALSRAADQLSELLLTARGSTETPAADPTGAQG